MCRINILYYFSGKGQCTKGHRNFTILDHNGSRVIKSPEYPQNYPHNSDYRWILNTGSRKANVTFSVLDFNISKPYLRPTCDDYFKVSINIQCICITQDFKSYNMCYIEIYLFFQLTYFFSR